MTTHLPDDRNVPLLPRHRLTSALSALTAHRVVIVTAPGGYGKTTLMREFVANLPGAAFCWLSLDKADASLPIFLQQLDRTLARYLPPGGVFSYSPDRVYTAQAEVRNLARMIAVGLAGHSQDRLIIVMDDLHHVGFSGPVVTFVDALIHHLPPSVHLVIACRGRPPLSMGRLQARREVVTLTAGDLSFTPDEVQRLFQQCLGLEVSDPMLRAIHAQTEGWVTALLLLGAILRPLPQADWAGMLSRFPTGGAIFDFLDEEVFAPQPNSIQDFLLSTCMLSVLHPRVIERMLGIVGAAAVLQELEARSLFITPTLSGGSAYQYHPLFRRFLQQQVKVRRGEQEERRLQVAAGQIYESLGDLAQAIEHYLAAGEFGRATPLMAEVVDALLKALRHEVVQAWLQRVPVELLDTDPDLVYTRAQLSGWLAQLDSLPVLYQRALELYELRGDHRGLCRALSWVTSRFWKLRYPYFYDSTARWMASPDPTVALYGRVLRAASRTGRGEWAEAFAELEGLLADAPPATRIYFDLLETLAVLAAWLGDPKGAIRYGLPYVTGRTALGDFAWGIYTWVSYCMLGDSLGLDAFHRQYQRMEIPPDSTQLHHIIGMLGEGIIHLYHRRYDQAMDSLEGIQPFFNDGHSVRHTMGSEATSLAQAELGRLYLRQGRVEEARACFERNVELTSGYPEMTSCAYACMAEFCAAQGDLIKARSHLAKARSGDPPGVEGMTWIWVTVVAFKISLAAGDHPAAERLLIRLLQVVDRKGGLWLLLHLGVPQILPTLMDLDKHQPSLRVYEQLRALGEIAEKALQPYVDSSDQRVGSAAAHLLAKVHTDSGKARYPIIKVESFGTLRLLRNEEPVQTPDWNRTKVRLLLIILLLRRGRPVSKDLLTEALWPDAWVETARNSLRATIHGLKRSFEPDLTARSTSNYVCADRENLWLINMDHLSFDLWELEDTLAQARFCQRQGRPAEAIAFLQSACDLGHGTFLPEVAYADHFHEVRTRTETSYVQACLGVARHNYEQGEMRSAIEYGRRALAVDPTAEDAYQILIQAYLALSERDRAIQVYKACHKYMRQMLGSEPSAAIRGLLEA